MLEHIYVIVGSGMSDIGKGWLTASIASVLPNAVAVKIDPMLNCQFPSDVGIMIEGIVMSDDFSTYRELGLPIHPDFNILGGALLLEFLQQPEKKLGRGSIKKLTIPDVSDFLADKLLALTDNLENCRNLVIEVGGIITDLENIYIPNAIKALGFKTGITPKVVVLSYLEYVDFGFPIKTHHVRQAIRETRQKYSLPIKACFVRRRYVPDKITDEQIREELVNIAFDAHLLPTQIVYEANFPNLQALKEMVRSTGIFKDEDEVYLVSACLMGVPCRYDETPAKVSSSHKVLNLLKGRGVVTICPELLAGLPTWREPVEIVGGDGDDVLDGKARIVSRNGNDYTQQFIDGARKALEAARQMNVTKARLCDNSPSCGCLHIYDGSFNHQKLSGCGVFAALLKRNGIECVANFD